MASKNSKRDWEIERHYNQQVKPLLIKTHWLIRVTDHRDKPSPVFVVKERLISDNTKSSKLVVSEANLNKTSNKLVLKDRGLLYGEPQRRCLPIIRTIISRIDDPFGIQLQLPRFFPRGSITFRGNLPLDEEAGAKLCLIFKLQERLKNMNRVELIARRVDRFTREEAAYWLSRITNFGPVANRWAVTGLRIMIGGQPGDHAIKEMLEQMR